MADVLESCGHPLLRTHGLAAARILPDGDAQDPPPYFVPRGFGAPSGLSHLEHFQWGLTIPHPGDNPSAHLSKELLEALLYELQIDAEDIDEHRRGLARRWLDMARVSQELKPAWLSDVAEISMPVVQQLAGPMINLLIHDSQFPDTLLMEDVKGFPLVGPLPPVHLSRDDRPPKPKGLPVSVSDLRARRSEINQVVLAGVRE